MTRRGQFLLKAAARRSLLLGNSVANAREVSMAHTGYNGSVSSVLDRKGMVRGDV
jgi:hypothetical protein